MAAKNPSQNHPASTAAAKASMAEELEADRIFCQVLELPKDQWLDFVEQQCAGRPKLRALVEDLLDASGDDWDPLLDGGLENQSQWLQEAEHLLQSVQPGRRFGSYRLLDEIGRGGMGVVYLAERADGQFDQKVALKLVQHGAGAATLNRFRRERQILAALEHSSIARLLDGGVSEDGVPFLVMEYVDGRPIDHFCAGKEMPLKPRLELFLQVCRAVSAAHRQLVVHRDLKPSNILVTPDGTVKLLDFGIAKLLSHETGLQTEENTRAMTPSYASPEQFRGDRVTVASDVYQLGLLLYALLTGSLPYDVRSAGITDSARVICEERPARPSVMLRSSLGNSQGDTDSEGLAHLSPHDLERWIQSLRGDLDNIIAKALEKEPGDRYPSVEALASDLENFLHGLPVKARRPTLTYVLGKFVSRNRWPVASGTAALLMITGLTFGYTQQLTGRQKVA